MWEEGGLYKHVCDSGEFVGRERGRGRGRERGKEGHGEGGYYGH